MEEITFPLRYCALRACAKTSLGVNKEDKKLYKHPTIKPLDIIKNLIINSSSEGDTVLDCFMGSGTTGVACINTGRNFIGIELDKQYFEIAERRIKEIEK